MALQGKVRQIHARKRGRCGSRQMAQALQREDERVGRDKARRLMREAKVVCRQRRRFRVTTASAHDWPLAPNHLARRFTAAAPNRVWVADITAIWAGVNWLYLAALMDLFDRQIVGWAADSHMRGSLVQAALAMGVRRRQPRPGLLHHSDRGVQYAARDYREQLQRHGMIASMSRKGDCWDNAVMERFFGSLKSEWLDGQRYNSPDEACQDVRRYIEIEYHCDRSHSSLGMMTPREKALAVEA